MELKVAFGGKSKVDVLYKGFTIKTDQPVEDGGENSAPAPFDLFMASIAACAGYYVLAFCSHRNISMDGIGLKMNGEWNAETRTLGKINIGITLSPDFPEKYINAVVKSAELCAVTRHFKYPPEISVNAQKSG